MPDLPTGTVTFLFTDIEGSTRLLQALGERYAQLQDDHAAILRAAIAEGDGLEIRTEGDAFFAVFPTASGAVRSAVAAQRRFAAHPWPDDGVIRVRMGLHTGEGNLGGDDYLGIDVNRAARIAATGHGGQIVISDATRSMTAGALPEGVSIRDLDDHRLKDFDRPEHLHDLVIDGLSSEFPVLRSLDARRTNLPEHRTSFVGRASEVTEVGQRLDEVRLLTLTGPGGTGKTRLALKVASARLGRYRDGVYLVDLSAVTEPAFLVPEIGRVLRVQEQPGSDPMATLRDHLRDREMLLVLDNLEQLIEASPVVGTLLDGAPGVSVLATSRIPLRISGEQEFPVAPLPLPDPGEPADAERLTTCGSVRLFVDRAAAVRPGLAITDANAGALAQIVSRLDGLPLALELAASRMRVLTLDALAERLGQRLPLLTGGARDLPERQRTLEATIAWSHELLEPDRQRLFGRLAVFSGGWTLETAEAVCGTDVDVLDGLGALADDSLVRRTELPGGRLRFSMLETIREFATGKLAMFDVDEREALHRRHAMFFRDLAEEAEPFLTGEHQATWLETLEQEHDNIRAALDRAARSSDPDDVETGIRTASAIWRFFQQRGRLAEGRAYLEHLLVQPSAQERDAIRARGLGALGSIAYWQRDDDAVPVFYEEAAAIARELDDRHLLAQALLNLSFVQDYSPGAMERRIGLLEESLTVADEGDVFLRGQIWTGSGYAKLFAGDREGAAERMEKAVELQRRSGDQFALAESLGGLASLAFDSGDVDETRRLLREVAGIVAESPSPVNLCPILLPYARVAHHDGRYELAARLVGAYNRVEQDYDVHVPQIGITFIGDPGELALASLGEEAYERARAEGFALTFQEMFALVADLAAQDGEPGR